jgi:hypothetical protein
MRNALAHPRPIELTADPRFAPRVKRLALTSMVALGIIWALAVMTLQAPPLVDGSLAAGWVLMPATLFASLARPRLRYALVAPASLVGFSLLAISIAWLPAGVLPTLGWMLMTAGVTLGGMLGSWFWFRLLPVPPSLDDPYSPGRWALIGIHVAMIVLGIALAGSALIS